MKRFLVFFATKFKNQKIYKPFILPTWSGFSLGAVTLVFISFSINTKNTVLFLFCFVIAFIGLLSLYVSNKSFENLKLFLVLPPWSFLNSTSIGYLKVKVNNSWHPNELELSAHSYFNDDSLKINQKYTIELPFNNNQKLFNEKLEFKYEYSFTSMGLKTIFLNVKSHFPLKIIKCWKILFNNEKHVVFNSKVNHLNDKKIQSLINKYKNLNDDEPFIFDNWKEGEKLNKINKKILLPNQPIQILKKDIQYQKNIILLSDKHLSHLNLNYKIQQMNYWIDLLYTHFDLNMKIEILWKSQKFTILSKNDFFNVLNVINNETI